MADATTAARTRAFLAGTPAQVAGARSIRYRLLPQIDELRDTAADRLRAQHLSARTAEGFVLAIEGAANVSAERSASWWIDHRGVRPELLIADHSAGTDGDRCIVCCGARVRAAQRRAAR